MPAPGTGAGTAARYRPRSGRSGGTPGRPRTTSPAPGRARTARPDAPRRSPAGARRRRPRAGAPPARERTRCAAPPRLRPGPRPGRPGEIRRPPRGSHATCLRRGPRSPPGPSNPAGPVQEGAAERPLRPRRGDRRSELHEHARTRQTRLETRDQRKPRRSPTGEIEDLPVAAIPTRLEVEGVLVEVGEGDLEDRSGTLRPRTPGKEQSDGRHDESPHRRKRQATAVPGGSESAVSSAAIGPTWFCVRRNGAARRSGWIPETSPRGHRSTRRRERARHGGGLDRP